MWGTHLGVSNCDQGSEYGVMAEMFWLQIDSIKYMLKEQFAEK